MDGKPYHDPFPPLRGDPSRNNGNASQHGGAQGDFHVGILDYDGSVSNKHQFLDSIKSEDITSEQFKNEGVTVRLHSNNNVAVSTEIYRDKGIEKGKPFQRRGRFTSV